MKEGIILKYTTDFPSGFDYAQVDSTGKIVLTKNMLEYYGFHAGDSIRIIYTEGAVLVQKYEKQKYKS